MKEEDVVMESPSSFLIKLLKIIIAKSVTPHVCVGSQREVYV